MTIARPHAQSEEAVRRELQRLRQALQDSDRARAALEARLSALEVAPAGALRWVGEFSVSGAAAQNLDITGLDGNSVSGYIIEFYGITPGATNNEWWPNGADPGTAGESRGHYTASGVFGVASEVHLWGGGPTHIRGRTEVLTAPGATRTFLTQLAAYTDAANVGDLEQVVAVGVWTDQSTNLTSLRWRSASAVGLGVGTYARVWARVAQ